MRRYYVAESEAGQLVNQINQQQSKMGIFVNITIKPYRGKKYDPKKRLLLLWDDWRACGTIPPLV